MYQVVAKSGKGNCLGATLKLYNFLFRICLRAGRRRSSLSSVAVTMSNDAETSTRRRPPAAAQQDCLGCRIVGTGALGAVGLHALNQARGHQPGSLIGKRVLAGLGICEYSILVFSQVRIQ